MALTGPVEVREAPGPHAGIDRERLEQLIGEESASFVRAHPRSRELFERARGSLLGGVPMSWMTKWASPFPLFAAEGHGARITCVDGHEYVDLCLGDTGAMTGHSPVGSVPAIADRAARGMTMMLPTEDAAAVGEELTRRFGLTRWQFTVSATDANRFVVRLAREITQRPRILVFNYCYHGTVDETFATLAPDGSVRARAGNVGPPLDPSLTTKVVEFNDVDGLERALTQGDVACVLAEPALTNIGIVLPKDGFHAALRELTRQTGTLLVIDETHTFSTGPAGFSGAFGLEPDAVTIGKAIGSGVPSGAFGVTEEVAARIASRIDADYEDVGGVGGTLAGNALSLAAMRATLENVLTEDAFAGMTARAVRFTRGVAGVLESLRPPWHVTRLGCRAEYCFLPRHPRNGGEAATAHDDALEVYLHLAALNRGILLTPFHNMALMSPETTDADVDLHTDVFGEAVGAILR